MTYLQRYRESKNKTSSVYLKTKGHQSPQTVNMDNLSCYRSQTVFAIVELENFIIWGGPGRVEWGKWHWIWSYYTIYKYKFLKENILNILSTRESKRMTSLRYATYSSILPPSKGLAWILLLPF